MTFLWPLSTVVVCYNLCFDSLPGVKGTCQGSSPVYGHMVDMLAPLMRWHRLLSFQCLSSNALPTTSPTKTSTR